jgi:undecaprenyl diphosphate synthase
MDGNRRWATAKNLAKNLGHHRGAETTEEIVELCVKNGIEIVSFWALAKKNVLERSQQELNYLYALFEEFLGKIEASCVKNNIRFEMVGDKELLPQTLRDSLRKLRDRTASFDKMILILAIGYGGQDEIVRAVKRAIRE